ncbi:unnamed protein product [Agarophyton chilense]|eukprot:gb/GEZJ01002646.1/.p1 GENE.gb/GEZJ01002646.1/~~gb/GEZJ01002646.1/.p1  ORF type:complete len:428 (-),score=79.00 gb/GEZJ01002646.1/:805-1953(-)
MPVSAFAPALPLRSFHPAARTLHRRAPPLAPPPSAAPHVRASIAVPSPNFAPDPAWSPAPFAPLPSVPSTPASYRVTVVSPQPRLQSHLLTSHVTQLVLRSGADVCQWRQLSHVAIDAKVHFPSALDIDALRATLFRLGRTVGADVVVQPEHVAAAHKRLAVFDLDSTLIAQETIDELAAEIGVQPRVKQITERAMNGEIAFRDALAQRVALLQGLSTARLDAVKQRVRFTPGAFRLVKALRRMGCTTAVISGGFHFLADHVRDCLGLDFSFANRLEVDAGDCLTGRTVGDIVDAEFKQNTLQMLAHRFQLRSEQVLAVGDGSNDLLMMQSAGLGVAFNAKPSVQHRAKVRVNQRSLTNVLYLLGLSEERISALVDDDESPR